jgi:hypothetical protein
VQSTFVHEGIVMVPVIVFVIIDIVIDGGDEFPQPRLALLYR